MTDELDERDLRERFAALRAEDAQAAPDFGALRRRVPAPAAARPPLRLVLAAAALVVLAIGLLRLRRPAAPDYPIDLASTTWHGPTDYLLKLPDAPNLRTVPRIGETELNWRIE